MPDVSRSDSQRSDSSQKPRVSFNRDVHVKRIGREGVVSALAGDGEGHLVPLPVRRERPGRLSRRELEKEAQSILKQAESIHCTPTLGPPDKFSTLPPRPQAKRSGPPPASSIFNSLERRKKKSPSVKENANFSLKRRNSNPDPLFRTSSSSPERARDSSPEIRTRKKLERSRSDVGEKKTNSIFATLDRIKSKKNKEKKPQVILETSQKMPPGRKKKQLSPIIEISPFKFEQEVRSASPTVVYAEVIARPGHGKTTVHTSVSQEPAERQQVTDEDEGVEMGHHENVERQYYENGTNRKPKEYTIDIKRENDMENNFPEDRIINMLRSRSSPMIDMERHRHEYKTERIIKIEGADEPDGRGRADGMDYNGRRKDSHKEYDESYKILDSFDKRKSFEDLDRIIKPEVFWNRPLESSLIDSNDLSLRRDRLESRIGIQRRRYLSNADDIKGFRDKTDEARKDFLMSQIEDDKDRYFETRIATEKDNHRQIFTKSKDLFADSGIEMNDYRKDKREVSTLNRRNIEVKTKSKSTPTLNKSEPERPMRHKERTVRRGDYIPTSTTLVKNYTKPPQEEDKRVKQVQKTEKKKEKLSKMDKVKQLMFGSKDGKKKKKKKQAEEEEEDPLTSRYTEYRGDDVSLTPTPLNKRKQHTSSSDVGDKTDQELEYYGSRQRLATPSPRPPDYKNKQDDNWLKSLTRRNKHKVEKKSKSTPRNNHEDIHRSYEPNNKTLRFFGDTDQESLKSENLKEIHRLNQYSTRDASPSLLQSSRYFSSREVSPNGHQGRHSSSRNASPSLLHSQHYYSSKDISPNPHLLQVPIHRPVKKRHSLHESSADSTTEGDSSQHSQKSVVYLHAATVGDIPGSRKVHRSVLNGGRRSQSREELSSNNDTITPHSRTLSRSISVLAPWRPRHNRNEINYEDVGKPPKPPKTKSKMTEIKENKKPEKKDKKNGTKLNRKDFKRSNENFINGDYDNGKDSSKERINRSRDNLVFVGKREIRDDNYIKDKKRMENSSSTLGRKSQSNNMKSTEHLERMSDKNGRDLSRSMTIPKDTRLMSGWFKNKNNRVGY
uniref:Uncharacterized protein n=1 Tax=Clastoptera arizonana TaxID=38151 RepID=A0A1B6E428_9HEMI